MAPWRSDERLSWTRPSGWHVTLAFLGEVEEEPAEVTRAVRVGCEQAAVATVQLTTGGVTRLGRGALALQVEDAPPGTLAGLGADVQAALVQAGLPVVQRPVRPHLTLGRARRRRPVPRDLLASVTVPPVGWRADQLQVVQSILGKGPATYEPVAAVEFSDSPPG